MFENPKQNRQFNFCIATGIAFHRVRLVSLLHAPTFSSISKSFFFAFWIALFHILDNHMKKKTIQMILLHLILANGWAYRERFVDWLRSCGTLAIEMFNDARGLWICQIDRFDDFALFFSFICSFDTLFPTHFNDAFQNDLNFLFHWIDQQFNWMHSTEACIFFHRTFFIPMYTQCSE